LHVIYKSDCRAYGQNDCGGNRNSSGKINGGANSSNQAASSAQSVATTTTANTTKNVTAAVKAKSTTAPATPTPIVITPTPAPVKQNYHVSIIIHCAGTMCNNGYTEPGTLQPYYANNPRVTIALAHGFNTAVYNATLEPGAINGDWVRGTVQETGQMVYLPWGVSNSAIAWIDTQLAM
jgi:hypothetical protein